LNPRRSPLLSVLTGGATRPGAPVAPGLGGPAPIQTSLPDPDLNPDDFEEEEEEEEPYLDPEGGLDDDPDEDPVGPAAMRADMWKIYQMGSRGPTWIHTERELAVTEETLLQMFGPGAYRVVAHYRGQEVGSYLVRIGTPEPVQPAGPRSVSHPAAAPPIPWEILERLRPPAAPDPLVIAERVARLLRIGQHAPPAPRMHLPAPVPESDLVDDQPRSLEWPEAILHLADLVAEKFTPAGAAARIEPAQVLTYLRDPGVLEEVLQSALQDPEISARIATYLGRSGELPAGSQPV